MREPTLQEILLTRKGAGPIPRIFCRDGGSMSVQVGSALYCTPRDDAGPYSHVEIGYPTFDPPERWRQYAEFPDDMPHSVFAQVPLIDVEWVIAAHGGIDYEKSLT